MNGHHLDGVPYPLWKKSYAPHRDGIAISQDTVC